MKLNLKKVLLIIRIIVIALAAYMLTAAYPLLGLLLLLAGLYYAYRKSTKQENAKPFSLKKWLQTANKDTINTILAASVIAVCLLAWETFLRTRTELQTYSERTGGSDYNSPYYVGARQGWWNIYAPNEVKEERGKEFKHSIKANALGLNDRYFALRSDSALRIAAFGDSFTEGIGADADSSYPRILQSILSHAEVLGCGTAGSDPVFACKLLQEKLYCYNLDVATFAINSSDIEDIMVRGGFERFRPDGKLKFKKGPWWEWLFGKYYIVRFWSIKVLRKDFFFLTNDEREIENQRSLRTLETTLDSIATLCGSLHIRPIFVFHPLQPEVQSGHMLCEPVMQYARQKGYETVDVLSGFQKQGVTARNCKEYYWPVDHHHNNRGYALIAQSIKDYLSPAIHQ